MKDFQEICAEFNPFSCHAAASVRRLFIAFFLFSYKSWGRVRGLPNRRIFARLLIFNLADWEREGEGVIEISYLFFFVALFRLVFNCHCESSGRSTRSSEWTLGTLATLLWLLWRMDAETESQWDLQWYPVGHWGGRWLKAN